MSVQDSREVIHPYLGFVIDPSRAGFPCTEIGFPGYRSALAPAVPGRLRIAVTGGSVAYWLCTSHGEKFQAAIGAAIGRGRDQLAVFPLALGGYKQPQQLMTFAYLLSLGARFDWLINIDGFNEVALHISDNEPKGVDFAYPRAWYHRLADFKDAKTRMIAAEISALIARREDWNRRFDGPIGRVLARIHSFGQGMIARRLARAEARFRAQVDDQGAYHIVGRGKTHRDEDELFAQLVGLWRDSSIQLHALCRGNGIEYFHVLQPNQYHEGSKPMGIEERHVAHDPTHPYCRGARRGYPMMIAAGGELRARGIRFLDQTQVFAAVEEMIYIDKCCHYNERGNHLLAEAIGAAIKTALTQ